MSTLTAASPEGTTETIAPGVALRMAARGVIVLDVDGRNIVVADRYDRTWLAEQWMAALRGPRGAAYVAAVRSGDEAQRKATWRSWTRVES